MVQTRGGGGEIECRDGRDRPPPARDSGDSGTVTINMPARSDVAARVGTAAVKRIESLHIDAVIYRQTERNPAQCAQVL